MGSRWKKFCACVGCVVGLACIVVSGGTATPLVAATLIGGGGAVGYLTGHKMDQDEKKVENQAQNLALKNQTIQEITKENKKASSEIEKLKKQHEEKQEQKQKNQRELEDAKKNANDPNLSEEDKKWWRNRVIELENKINRDEEEDQNILKRIKELQDKINNNNKSITTITSGSSNKDKKDIWEFITLENILIVVAIYALWQIVRDNNRR